MAYYQGDFYRGRGGRGDLWGAIGSLAKGAIGYVTGGIPGAIGAMVKRPTFAPQGTGGGGIVVHPGNILPGGKPFIERGHVHKKYKKINPTNVRALRRAIRRQAGFMTIVRRTLKGTGMTIKRTGMPTKKRGKR